MKVVVVKSPKVLSGLLRMIFCIKEKTSFVLREFLPLSYHNFPLKGSVTFRKLTSARKCGMMKTRNCF